jgi:hypothetical protein
MLTLPFSVAWIGAAIAIAQTALLLLHLRRRYPVLPKRVPIGLRWDGRPRATGPKALLWLAPAIVAGALAIVIAAMLLDHLRAETQTTMLFVFLVVAEVAWYVQWTIDRQIEMARGMTHRIAPTRMLLTALPILATIAVAIAVAITQSI